MADDSVDSVPADEDKLIAMIVARDDYKNRADREKRVINREAICLKNVLNS